MLNHTKGTKASISEKTQNRERPTRENTIENGIKETKARSPNGPKTITKEKSWKCPKKKNMEFDSMLFFIGE